MSCHVMSMSCSYPAVNLWRSFIRVPSAVCVCDADDRMNSTFSSSCSRTSSSADSDRTFVDSTSNWEEEQDASHLRPPRSPNPHYQQQQPQQTSSEWSEDSEDDRRPVSVRSPSYPVPYLSGSSTADSEQPTEVPAPVGSASRPRLLNVLDLPPALDAFHQHDTHSHPAVRTSR